MSFLKVTLVSIVFGVAVALPDQHPPGYSYPVPSYEAPEPSYHAPSPSYHTPSYEAPAPSYHTPSYKGPAPSYHAPKEHKGKPYDYTYAVKDDYKGVDYNAKEYSDGSNVVGEYRVLLPDGRTKIVTYTADHYKGFVADVTYEGEIQYHEPAHYKPAPSYKAHTPSYKAPAPAYSPPAYAPAPAYSPPAYAPAPVYGPPAPTYGAPHY